MNINVNIIIVNLQKQRMFHFDKSTVFTGMDLQVHEYGTVSAVLAYCQGNLNTDGSGSTSEDTRRPIVITALYTNTYWQENKSNDELIIKYDFSPA